jgi:Fic family protein
MGADFALGHPQLEVTREKLAAVLGVSGNTAARALEHLTDGGHLVAEKRPGLRTVFRPVLREEGRA